MTNYLELRPNDGRKSFYGKAKVRIDADGSRTLISYTTPVCRINPDGKFVKLWSGYSATTMRHINAFCDTYGINGRGKRWWDAL
jgi:hypothetical protein